MRISGNEPSSVILRQTKWFQKWKCWPKSAKTSWSQKGWCNNPTKLQFKSILTQKILMLSKRYESTEVDRRTWLHVDWSYYECYCAFYLVSCGSDTSHIVSVHIQCQASIYTLSLCRVHSCRVRLAKQETLTPPGHLVSPLVYRVPWMSTVVLYCWCYSDSASVFLF